MKKLKKLITTYHTGTYKTKFSDIQLWFDIVNNVIFNRRVPDFRYYHIQKMRDACGMVILGDKKEKDKWIDLYMLPNYRDFKTFVEVLGHEMVHAYQYWIVKDNSCNHNHEFYRWKTKFRSNGLTLSLTVDNMEIK